MFLKIKLVDELISDIINYKDLFKYIIKGL